MISAPAPSASATSAQRACHALAIPRPTVAECAQTHAGSICPDPTKIPCHLRLVRLLTSSPTLLEKRRAAGQQTNDGIFSWDLCGIWTDRPRVGADTTKIPAGRALVAPWRAGSLSPAPRLPWPSCRSFFQSGDGFQSADPRSQIPLAGLSFQLLLAVVGHGGDLHFLHIGSGHQQVRSKAMSGRGAIT